MKRFDQELLAGTQQEGQRVLDIQPKKQGLAGFLRHVSEASGNGAQVSDKSNGDACDMFLFEVQKMEAVKGRTANACKP